MNIQPYLEDLKRILKKENLRYTTQRVEILKEIANSNHHLECEDIYFALRKKGVDASLATIYRTMDLLVKHQFVRKLNIGDGRARYENKLDGEHHDHLICTECGNIKEFVEDDIEILQEEIGKKYGFKLTKHIHQLYGICEDCQNETD